MSRMMKLLALAILTAAIAVIGSACEQLHYDMYFGTDAGAGFDAPAREVADDGSPDDTPASGTVNGGVIVDAGDQGDGGAGGD
jgi:hypothetical protein